MVVKSKVITPSVRIPLSRRARMSVGRFLPFWCKGRPCRSSCAARYAFTRTHIADLREVIKIEQQARGCWNAELAGGHDGEALTGLRRGSGRALLVGFDSWRKGLGH